MNPLNAILILACLLVGSGPVSRIWKAYKRRNLPQPLDRSVWAYRRYDGQ